MRFLRNSTRGKYIRVNRLHRLIERCRRETLFEDKRQKVLAQLDETMKKECLCLFEEANAISAYDCEQAYIEGMRMGARLTAELLFASERD